jgi:hypothetical protein
MTSATDGSATAPTGSMSVGPAAFICVGAREGGAAAQFG